MNIEPLQAFCLNLTRRPDRKLQAWEQFRREKLEVARIAAPDAVNVEEARGWRNKGARACAAGHRLAWREARKRGAEAVLVFEDDVVLCRGFRERLEGLALQEDWKIVYLGCTFRDVPEPVSPRVVRVRGRTWATHAMLLRAEILPDLHRLLAPWSRRGNRPPVPQGVDGVAIDDLICVFHPEWPVYAAYPFLAWQAPGVSAIDGRLSEAWDKDGRQLWCPEVVASLDRLLGIAPPRSLTTDSANATAPPVADGKQSRSKTVPALNHQAHPSGAGQDKAGTALLRAVPPMASPKIVFSREAKLQSLPMYCLNLKRRPDRKIRAWSQFRRHGLEVTSIEAPDALNITDARGWMLKGYRACAAAHRLAMRAARKMGAGAVIIFEDDVVLCDDFRERFAAIKLPEDWGIFFFGCVFLPPGPELLPGGLLRVQGGTFDNHAYAVRAELWPEIAGEYGRMSAKCGNWHLDVPASSDRILSTLQNRCATYSVWPPMAWQSTGLSNNMNEVNGNSDATGRQIIHREAIAHLPEVPGAARGRAGSGGPSPVANKHPVCDDQPDGTVRLRVAGCGRHESTTPQSISDSGGSPASGLDSAARMFENGGQSPPLPVVPASPGSPAVVRGSASGARGILLSPYSPVTERMAWGNVRLLRRYNPEVPVVIYAQDYLPRLPWRGMARVIHARGCHAGRDDMRWLNKLEALVDSPFEETLFFDCDMASAGPVSHWFDEVGTDDLTFWQEWRTPESAADEMHLNHLNPHVACPYYGVKAVPGAGGGGHYFVRKSERARRLINRAADLMLEAYENPGCLYWKLAGKGNIIGDEPAACMAMTEMGVKFPEARPPSACPVGVFMAPWQKWREPDFENGRLSYDCRWAKGVREPLVVHFAGPGKNDPAYQAWLASCLPEADNSPRKDAAAGRRDARPTL